MLSATSIEIPCVRESYGLSTNWMIISGRGIAGSSEGDIPNGRIWMAFSWNSGVVVQKLDGFPYTGNFLWNLHLPLRKRSGRRFSPHWRIPSSAPILDHQILMKRFPASSTGFQRSGEFPSRMYSEGAVDTMPSM